MIFVIDIVISESQTFGRYKESNMKQKNGITSSKSNDRNEKLKKVRTKEINRERKNTFHKQME